MAENFSYRIPDTLEVEINADVILSGDKNRLQLSGPGGGRPAITIVDGRYFQAFNVFHQVVTQQRVSERTTPFWQGTMLEKLALNLKVVTSAPIEVHNDLAKIALSGGLSIGGTLSRPLLDGQIRVEEGSLKIPFAPPEFQVRRGTVSFQSAAGKIPDATPRIDLQAETLFTDRNSAEHLVTLSFEGTLGKFTWDLRTNTGLNKTDTLALITTGNTVNTIRAESRGDVKSPGSQGGGASPVGSSSSFVSAGNQVLTHLTTDLISTLIEDPLKDALSLDCVRVGVGTESLQAHLCKKIIRTATATFDYELGFRGPWAGRVGVDYKWSDKASLVLEGVKQMQERETDESDLEGRLRFKVKFIIP